MEDEEFWGQLWYWPRPGERGKRGDPCQRGCLHGHTVWRVHQVLQCVPLSDSIYFFSTKTSFATSVTFIVQDDDHLLSRRRWQEDAGWVDTMCPFSLLNQVFNIQNEKSHFEFPRTFSCCRIPQSEDEREQDGYQLPQPGLELLQPKTLVLL